MRLGIKSGPTHVSRHCIERAKEKKSTKNIARDSILASMADNSYSLLGRKERVCTECVLSVRSNRNTQRYCYCCWIEMWSTIETKCSFSIQIAAVFVQLSIWQQSSDSAGRENSPYFRNLLHGRKSHRLTVCFDTSAGACAFTQDWSCIFIQFLRVLYAVLWRLESENVLSIMALMNATLNKSTELKIA